MWTLKQGCVWWWSKITCQWWLHLTNHTTVTCWCHWRVHTWLVLILISAVWSYFLFHNGHVMFVQNIPHFVFRHTSFEIWQLIQGQSLTENIFTIKFLFLTFPLFCCLLSHSFIRELFFDSIENSICLSSASFAAPLIDAFSFFDLVVPSGSGLLSSVHTSSSSFLWRNDWLGCFPII